MEEGKEKLLSFLQTLKTYSSTIFTNGNYFENAVPGAENNIPAPEFTHTPVGSGMPIWCKSDRNPNNQKVGNTMKFAMPTRRLLGLSRNRQNVRFEEYDAVDVDTENTTALGVSFKNMANEERKAFNLKKGMPIISNPVAAQFNDSPFIPYESNVNIQTCSNKVQFDKNTIIANESAEDVNIFSKSSKEFFASDSKIRSSPVEHQDGKQRQTAPCRAKRCCARNDPNPECQTGNQSLLTDHNPEEYEAYKWKGDYIKSEETAQPDLQPCGSQTNLAFFQRKSMEYILDQDEKIKPGNASTKEMISEPCRTDQCCAASVFEDRLSPPCDRDAAFPRNLNQLPNKKQAVLGYFRQKSCEFGYSEEAEPQILHDDVPIVRRESLSARRYSTTPTEAPSLDSSIATFLAEDIECPKVETTFGSKRIPPDLLCTDDDDQVRYTLPK